MNLLKFIYSPKGGVLVKWEQREDTKPGVVHTVESMEEPSEELKAALQGLVKPFCYLCEFPEEWAEKITVRGVTVKHTEEGESVVITAFKKRSDGNPLVVNTPLEQVDFREVAALAVYALEYGSGLARAQKELPFEVVR